MVRTFDVKHHGAHGTNLINFGQKRGPIFSNSHELSGGFAPRSPHRALPWT
jgi:hypothetical protein